MATEVRIPFVEESIDLSNPTDAIMAIVLLVAGWAIFFMSQDLGMNLKSSINSVLGLGSEGQSQQRDIL